MSLQANQYNSSTLLELPSTWLAHLVQHIASGAGGLASAAALSQTCKSFYALSESPAVAYRNLHLDNPLNSLGHPFFRWLAKRQGCIAGLTAELRLSTVGGLEPERKQLQLMFSIPGLHLTLFYETEVAAADDPFMTQVLRPHGYLIDHLSTSVLISGQALTLQDFCEAAAPCRRLELVVWQAPGYPLDMGAFNCVAGSLVRLDLEYLGLYTGEVGNVSSLPLLSQLMSLKLHEVGFGADEPWAHLVGLTNLKQASVWIAASGDPSPLSALTGLSSLGLNSFKPEQEGLIIPYSFSSLQPLSTLQQLEELNLHGMACSATSLHGLAELSRLEMLTLDGPLLKVLEGMSTGLRSLTIDGAPQLHTLAGIEGLTALQQLVISNCQVASLQPVGQLVGGLDKLHVKYCHSVQEKILELPHFQPIADVRIERSNVEELVLAGGVRRRVRERGFLDSDDEEEQVI